MSSKTLLVAFVVFLLILTSHTPSKPSHVAMVSGSYTTSELLQPSTTTTVLPTTTTTTEPTPTTMKLEEVETTTTTSPPPTTNDPQPPPVPQGSVEDAIAQSFPDHYQSALNVSWCESRHDPSVISSGGGNWGLFQINRAAHEQQVEQMGYQWDQVLDPYVNATVARAIYDSAGGWGPWSCRWAA